MTGSSARVRSADESGSGRHTMAQPAKQHLLGEVEDPGVARQHEARAGGEELTVDLERQRPRILAQKPALALCGDHELGESRTWMV